MSADDGEGGARAAPDRGPRAPLRRLRTALRPRATRGQLLAGLLCAALGFALVVQLRVTQESGLDGLSEPELVRSLDELGDQVQSLELELSDLEQTRRTLESEGDRRQAALRSAQERQESLELLAGTVPAVGPGVRVSVVDPAGGVGRIRLVGVINELRDAGAEVVSVGGVRLVASTDVVDTARGVEVDGRPVTSPFDVLAIGDPARLSATIGIPGGVLDSLENEGATVTVEPREQLRITAVVDPPGAGDLEADPGAAQAEQDDG
ncbi:DUF881 domain-containing protein [Pseudokineococcus basanitobsidens]|uniref:DUF881 domain-containing protein n=1 Tax=Pseudokineococcus basanitobsidens TaxID=1926649 RepID=A0ABU8RIW9_9ACTN